MHVFTPEYGENIPGVEGKSIPGVEGKLLFSKFDLQSVLQNGASLLGSEGAQFNQDEKLAGYYAFIVKVDRNNFTGFPFQVTLEVSSLW